MFRSSFAKYLTAFIIIITVSFLMLSGIITSIIRTHVNEDKEVKLELSSSVLVDYFEYKNIENLDSHINLGGSSVVALIPLASVDYDFNIIITNELGEVLLTTVEKTPDRKPVISGELGAIDLTMFKTITTEERGDFLNYKGKIDGVVEDSSLFYGKPVTINERVCGYVFALSSTTLEDKLISVTRNTVINASIWVLLAALIAAYFITDKIIYPLKTMTNAAKRFAKGDFSERVTVYGNDEVAELGVAFNNMAESLENLEKMRYTFLASVSHDLRTPMTTISGFIDGINSGAIPPEEQKHYLGVISSEVHRLSRLVSQILDVSRLDSGDRKFVFSTFDIAELARLIIISFEQKLEEKQLDVEFITDEDSMYVLGDKDAIHQVIYNLCHNAIKFSNVGGKFIIKINEIVGKKIRFSVYDSGQPISKEDAAHIFERFYKTDESRGLDKSGVGLGLYICKTIIDAHEEQLRVETLTTGCEFWFTLKQGEQTNRQAHE